MTTEKGIHKRMGNSMGYGEIVASHSLGIGVTIDGMPGIFSVIIEKDTPLPAEGTRIYATSSENQKYISIMLYEGDKEKVKDNYYLGELIVSDIPPAPKGVEKVEITFRYNLDNTLEVSAKILSTGKILNTYINGPKEISDKKLQLEHKTIHAIGIYLGTIYSAMAFVDIGEIPKIINNREGRPTTPSVVAWRKKDNGNLEMIVGEMAVNQAIINPENTISSIKRMMGKYHKIRIYDDGYIPEEISARILIKLKMDAEENLGEEITNVVIAVPVYFRDEERIATKNAAIIAGWDKDKISLVNESHCIVMAYGLDMHIKKGHILIFDSRESTFDVTILNIREGISSILAMDGEILLGSIDSDNRIVNYIVEEFKKENDIDLRDNKEAMQRIIAEAETTKNSLSSNTSVEINIPFIVKDICLDRWLDIKKTLTREKFDELTKDLVERAIDVTKKTLKDANIKSEDIDIVMMNRLGISAVHDAIKKIFPDKKILLFDHELDIAKGAAIYSTILLGE